MTNNKRQGKEAELAAAKALNEAFGTDFRRSSQNAGALDAPDLVDDVNPGFAPEVKRRDSMNLHAVVARARSEAEGVNGSEPKVAFVVHKRRRERWLLTVDLKADAPELLRRLVLVAIRRAKRELDPIRFEIWLDQFFEGEFKAPPHPSIGSRKEGDS